MIHSRESRFYIFLFSPKGFELLKTCKCKAFVKYGYKSFYSCINNRLVVQFQMIWFCMIICGKFFGERYDKSNNIR